MLLDSGNGVMTLSTEYLLLEIKNKIRLAHLFICNLTVDELFSVKSFVISVSF